jgi:hypothetical protein
MLLRCGRVFDCVMRFSAGLEKSRAKAQSLAMKRFFRWTKVQLPLLKRGAPTTLGMERSAPSFPVLTQGLKPWSFGQGMARLKSCPDTKQLVLISGLFLRSHAHF